MGKQSRERRKDDADFEEYLRGLPARATLGRWIGRRFGLLTVYSFSRYKNNVLLWLCRCDCGECIEVWANNLLSGATTSCGHLMRQQQKTLFERTRKKHEKHMHSYTRVYQIWHHMKYACESPKSSSYSQNGGKGIRICPEWHEFSQFLSDMGEPEAGFHLRRFDIARDYEPENCYWGNNYIYTAPKTIRLIEWNGKRLSIAGWAREIGISHGALSYRLRAGWAIEKALAVKP